MLSHTLSFSLRSSFQDRSPPRWTTQDKPPRDDPAFWRQFGYRVRDRVKELKYYLLSVVASDKDEAARVLSQLKIVIRTNYSNPPTHGGAVVAAVLNNPELRALWEKELGEMRVRIKAMRQTLVDGLKAAGVKQDMSFMTQQIGMFSYSGLTKEQMVRLRSEFGVYGTDTGRICVAALNSKNIDYVCRAIAQVI